MTKGGEWPKRRLTEAVHEVDVFVAVDVDQLRSGRGLHYDGIHHVLPLAAESGGRAGVG
jgi:hypothetical protein